MRSRPASSRPRYASAALLAVVLAAALLLPACDLFGGNGDGGSGDAQTTVDLWAGTYEGTGTETNYIGFAPDETNIEPTLEVRTAGDTTSGVVLTWMGPGGEARVAIGGASDTLTEDSLVTRQVSTTIRDTIETRFRIRLARVQPDSSVVDLVEGRLRQVYVGGLPVEAGELDSTIVRFTASRAEE